MNGPMDARAGRHPRLGGGTGVLKRATRARGSLLFATWTSHNRRKRGVLFGLACTFVRRQPADMFSPLPVAASAHGDHAPVSNCNDILRSGKPSALLVSAPCDCATPAGGRSSFIARGHRHGPGRRPDPGRAVAGRASPAPAQQNEGYRWDSSGTSASRQRVSGCSPKNLNFKGNFARPKTLALPKPRTIMFRESHILTHPFPVYVLS
jgi:hypothetical protein